MYYRGGVFVKLIFAIVHDDDGPKVMDELNMNDFSVTRLCSTGGFLRAGNTTLLIGVEEQMLDLVVEIIERNSKHRKHGLKAPAAAKGNGGVLVSMGKEVEVGGATIFITDVQRFEKV